MNKLTEARIQKNQVQGGLTHALGSLRSYYEKKSTLFPYTDLEEVTRLIVVYRIAIDKIDYCIEKLKKNKEATMVSHFLVNIVYGKSLLDYKRLLVKKDLLEKNQIRIEDELSRLPQDSLTTLVKEHYQVLFK